MAKNNTTAYRRRRKLKKVRVRRTRKYLDRQKKATERRNAKKALLQYEFEAPYNTSFSVTNEELTQDALGDVFCPVALDSLEEGDRCQICLHDFTESEPACRLSKCKGHFFHQDCIREWVETQRYCPICKARYGIRTGIMPAGTFSSYVMNRPCEGFDCKTLCINWSIPSGTQTDIHPNPGQSYRGAHRTGYLPFNKKGRLVWALMKLAFERRLMFTVGYSITRRVDNVVIWNEIHAKTSMYGGATNWGYPDDSYLDRVIDELRAKGVTESDLKDVSRPPQASYSDSSAAG